MNSVEKIFESLSRVKSAAADNGRWTLCIQPDFSLCKIYSIFFEEVLYCLIVERLLQT